ncbi:MAG: DHA2 family efflux MFS transporter permease subunit [Steroidobacteraceae bacterium]
MTDRESFRPLDRRMITLSIMAATIMQTLDTTIANVALPHMQGAMSASQDQIAWVLTSYIVAAAIATPLTGWLVDRFGQKAVFLASVIGFTVASALCGLSDSLAEIVAARLLQGVFGAALVPMSQVVLMDINPPAKQGSAMAIWGVGVMVGPILGPTLGGWLTDSYSWRWVFFINIPVGIMTTYGIWKYIHPRPAARRVQFDLFGFAALSIAIGALQMLLDRGQQNDWFSSTETWIETITMSVAFTYFIAHTALTRADRSFLDYRLLKNRNYATGLMFIFIVGLVMYATRALIPTMLEDLLDYPVTITGLVTAPSGIGTMASMLLAGRILGKIDLRLILFCGFSITALSLYQMTGYSQDLSQSDIVWPGVIQGIGLGFVFVPLSTATFATLSPEMRAQGTALFSLVRNIGSSIGISLVQAVLVHSTANAHAALVERITYSNPAWTDPAIASAYDLGRPSGAAALDALITAQASMIAYINDFRLMLYLTLAVIPLVLFVRIPGNGATAAAHAVMD